MMTAATAATTAGPAVDPEKILDLYPPLASLPVDRLNALLRPQAVMRVPAGTMIFAEHQPCQGFPLLLEGSIKVVKQAASGRELMLYRVAPGGSCIITSSCLLGHRDYNARGIAESPLSLLLMPAPVFAQLMLDHAPFRDFVFHLFAERIGELMQLVEEVAFARLDQQPSLDERSPLMGTAIVDRINFSVDIEQSDRPLIDHDNLRLPRRQLIELRDFVKPVHLLSAPLP